MDDARGTGGIDEYGLRFDIVRTLSGVYLTLLSKMQRHLNVILGVNRWVLTANPMEIYVLPQLVSCLKLEPYINHYHWEHLTTQFNRGISNFKPSYVSRYELYCLLNIDLQS